MSFETVPAWATGWYQHLADQCPSSLLQSRQDHPELQKLYHHQRHHHQLMLMARGHLSLSRHPSQSLIAPDICKSLLVNHQWYVHIWEPTKKRWSWVRPYFFNCTPHVLFVLFSFHPAIFPCILLEPSWCICLLVPMQP